MCYDKVWRRIADICVLLICLFETLPYAGENGPLPHLRFSVLQLINISLLFSNFVGYTSYSSNAPGDFSLKLMTQRPKPMQMTALTGF